MLNTYVEHLFITYSTYMDFLMYENKPEKNPSNKQNKSIITYVLFSSEIPFSVQIEKV